MAYKSSTFIGNLTADPELKTLNGDKRIATFSLAINTKFGDKEISEFFDFEAWEGKADLVSKHLHKGDMIFLTSTPKVQSWQDKDGITKRKIVFVVNEIKFLSVKKGE